MGFRFRKTIKVAPGVRLNIGKKGVSTSVGKRGAGVTFGPKGTTAHVGIPGTGMSYTSKINSQSQGANVSDQKTSQNKSSGCGCGYFLAGLLIFVALSSFLGIYVGAAVLVFLFILFALSGNSNKK